MKAPEPTVEADLPPLRAQTLSAKAARALLRILVSAEDVRLPEEIEAA